MQANDGLEKSTSGEFEENGRRKETKNMDIKINCPLRSNR